MGAQEGFPSQVPAIGCTPHRSNTAAIVICNTMDTWRTMRPHFLPWRLHPNMDCLPFLLHPPRLEHRSSPLHLSRRHRVRRRLHTRHISTNRHRRRHQRLQPLRAVRIGAERSGRVTAVEDEKVGASSRRLGRTAKAVASMDATVRLRCHPRRAHGQSRMRMASPSRPLLSRGSVRCPMCMLTLLHHLHALHSSMVAITPPLAFRPQKPPIVVLSTLTTPLRMGVVVRTLHSTTQTHIRMADTLIY